MTDAPRSHVRPLKPDDRPAALELLAATLGTTPYFAAANEVLTRAAMGDDREHRALVLPGGRGIVALALLGHIAGTAGGARLFTVVWRDGAEREGGFILEAAADAAAGDGARFLLAEVPDDPATATMRRLLLEHGFIEEARIPDFVRDGVSLVFLRRTFSIRHT